MQNHWHKTGHTLSICTIPCFLHQCWWVTLNFWPKSTKLHFKNHTPTPQRFLFLVLSVPQSVMWDTWPRCPTVKGNIPVPTRASRTSVPAGRATLNEQGALGAGHFRALWAELTVLLVLPPLLSQWGSSTCKAHLYAHFDLTHRAKLSGS